MRFLDFWIFGFLDFWIFGFLDFWIFVKEARLEEKMQTGPVVGIRIEASNRRTPSVTGRAHFILLIGLNRYNP